MNFVLVVFVLCVARFRSRCACAVRGLCSRCACAVLRFRFSLCFCCVIFVSRCDLIQKCCNNDRCHHPIKL